VSIDPEAVYARDVGEALFRAKALGAHNEE
jgi:hypothetical protein